MYSCSDGVARYVTYNVAYVTYVYITVMDAYGHISDCKGSATAADPALRSFMRAMRYDDLDGNEANYREVLWPWVAQKKLGSYGMVRHWATQKPEHM